MQPTQITYHGMDPSTALTELIHSRVEQLERVSDRIHSVRVLVDAPHQSQRQGNHYRVRIELKVPGSDIVVGHDAEDRTSDEDAYGAVRRAFDIVRRRLTTVQARARRQQRTHGNARVTIRTGR